MPVFRRKVTKGIPKPGEKGHFGTSPEFVAEPTGLKQKPALKSKRRKPKF